MHFVNSPTNFSTVTDKFFKQALKIEMHAGRRKENPAAQQAF